MFSISAINDTDSKTQWEPLAPTKEALEFHLIKTYHDGLLQLQNKEYEKAQELLESILKDPLIASALVDDESGESHLLQLRFLALKNLATVFLRQGSDHHENALRCYLQAVEIDNKDSVVWNQLGTLSCSMGLLNISRWAFEQGLSCSPNNWNCMEKLLEVLIAIGDEVACLSVAELILRHWPSHSRALLVKNTIEELDPVPFAPRGIDKLKPNHVRLTFLDKRKSTDSNLDQDVTLKKMKKSIEVELSENSCTALADALLDILDPLKGRVSEMEVENEIRSGDVNVLVRLPLYAESSKVLSERRELISTSFVENESLGNLGTERASTCKEKEGIFHEEQPQERRSTRLERLRSRKPGKEEIDFDAGKDLGKVTNYLQPFLANGSGAVHDAVHDANCSDLCSDQDSQCGTDYDIVSNFLKETLNNYGAYHLGHLLLERASISYLPYQDAFIKFLELEKLTRHWGKERTAACNLFLAELYFDFASSFLDASKKTEFMLDSSYHICKIIEVVAFEYPWNFDSVSRHDGVSQRSTFEGANGISTDYSSNCGPLLHCLPLESKKSFWVRFFWLSGKLSIWDGNRVKACEELGISLSLLKKEIDMDSSAFVKLPHLQIVKKLTIDRILHDISILKVELLMEKTVPEMFDKQMFMECKSLLHPLLFSTNDVHVDPISFHCTERMSEEFTSIELSALDVLRKSCEKTKPLDIILYMNSHKKKLQILVAAAGLREYFNSFEFYPHRSVKIKTNLASASEVESKERSSKHWGHLVAEEVKAISRCTSEVKNFVDNSRDPHSVSTDPSIISDLQSLLLSVMCNIARVFLCKKSSGQVINDQVERCCFVNGAITFCKLQHLDLSVPPRVQVELIVAMHDLLAEYGLCCWGEVGSGEEGMFLKFAIKHLLALDMKLKAGEQTQNEDAGLQNNSSNISSNQPILETSHMQMGCSDKSSNKDVVVLESTASEAVSSSKALELDGSGSKGANQMSYGSNDKFNNDEKTSIQLAEFENDQNEEEKEELELKIDCALDQCFFCLYGLNLRCDSSYEEDLAMHKNTSRGDYQTKEQCADVLQYILPYAKASSRMGLVKLRRVLRAIRKHFPQPPEDVLAGNAIDKFLDDSNLCEDTLSDEAGSDKFLETMKKILLNEAGSIKQYKASLVGSSEPYMDVYCNLYYFLALSEETNATDKWPGFVLTKEGEEFVQQNAKLLKFDLLYNPLRFESWQRLANIYDEEVDLLLNDGSKHINVVGWRKNDALPQRVEISRRRSRRCLLMSLALAKSSSQQGEIHELLALVYYDSLQSVVPFFDQRSAVPTKDATWILCCNNSMKHFKKAFAHKQDWSHAFYMGKLSEKLGYSREISLSHYAKAIALNPSAADPVYRMHASRLKLLFNCGIQSSDVFKVLSTYSFEQKNGETVMEILNKMAPEISQFATSNKDRDNQSYSEEENKDLKMKEVRDILYNDCLSALESCVEGDLKHFHKARFMLAQGMYKRGESSDVERAKDELSFCFKSSRSSFTINMWEIDSMVKRGRRKTPGLAGTKKILEVNLPESSRKFITCIRKYLLFYLKLLEETGDTLTLERAYISLRSDKRFSLCIEDLVPVSLGRYIKALIASIHQTGIADSTTISSPEHVLEKLFALFIEQGNLWPDICSLPEIKNPGISESILYGYLHEHIKLLERNRKLENLEGVNEKIRKRFKSSKLTNNECTKICKHASIAWCRCLIINLILITPLLPKPISESQIPNLPNFGLENQHLLCVELQINEIWSSQFDDSIDLRNLQLKWGPILSKIKNIILRKVADENLENAQSLLRSAYNFYRESSCVMLPSGVNLYNVPHRLATGMNFHPSMEGVEILDLSLPRKLLLWAYTLLHGHCANISAAVKHCEENLKSKTKKGHGNSTPLSQTSLHGVISPLTGVKDSFDTDASLGSYDATNSTNPVSPFGETQKNTLTTTPQLHQFKNLVGEGTDSLREGDREEI